MSDLTPRDLGIRLGVHLSISGGIDKTPRRARDLGINAFQIFSQNVRSWKTREIGDDEARRFRESRSEFELEFAVIHTSYLLNLASPDQELWKKSQAGLARELKRAHKLGINHVNAHIGAHTGSGLQKGLSRLIEALNSVAKTEAFRNSEVRILLENTAGAGTALGGSFCQFNEIFSSLSQPDRFGICLDTCHAYAGGYDISSPSGLTNTLDQLDREVGLDRLELIHLNDSKGELDSHLDKHQHIGEGEIGEQGFKNVVTHPKLKSRPMVLETPKEELRGMDSDKANLCKIIELVRAGSG